MFYAQSEPRERETEWCGWGVKRKVREREREIKRLEGEREGVWRQRRGISLWLQFGRVSIHNTKAGCANNEFVNC